MKCKVCLVGRHSRRTAVRQEHREIELGWPQIYKHRIAWHAIFETHHIPHKASLKAKLFVLFYLLPGMRDIASGSPCGGELTASGILRSVKVAEIGCRRALTVERLCGRTQALAIDITVRVGVWLACNYEQFDSSVNEMRGKDEPYGSGCIRSGGVTL
jgi:hypothetical protein